jgi:hypothetical protein
VSIESYKQSAFDLDNEMHATISKAKRIMGGRIIAKHQDLSKFGGMNLTKASMVTDFMFSPMGLNLKPKLWTPKPDKDGNKKPSTALDHILMFEDVPEAKAFVAQMKRYSQAEKVKGTYVDGFLEHLRSDGRFHPTYFLFKGDKAKDDGGTNCLPAGELVLTNRGYLPVKQVQTGDLVITHRGRPRKVVSLIQNGVKHLVRVTLSNGLVLTTTENHPYRVGDGWVDAAQLIAGMQAWAHSGIEEWEPVKDWSDWEVSSWGRVFNRKTKHFATQYPKGEWGHLKVMLVRNGARKRGEDRKDFAVHILVSNAFVEKFGGTEVRHLNGCAWDNTVGNLVWGTSQENRDDAVRHGSMSFRKSNKAKLTEEDAKFIRSAGDMWNNRELAKKFGVSRELVRDVRLGKRWLPEHHDGKNVEFKPVYVVKVAKLLVPGMTYGLGVEEDHSHVTGGIVTHNTGRTSCRALEKWPNTDFKGLEFDRVNNDGPYSPDNLQLLTSKEHHLKREDNVYLSYKGLKMHWAAWPSPYSPRRTQFYAAKGFTGEEIIALARKACREKRKGWLSMVSRLRELGYLKS